MRREPSDCPRLRSPTLFAEFSSIYRYEPLRVQVDQGAMAMKGYSAFPKAAALLEPHHQFFCVIFNTLVRRDLPFCRDAVGIFYNPSRLGYVSASYPGHLLGESYPSAEGKRHRSEFELQSSNYIPFRINDFGKRIDLLINIRTTTHEIFYTNCFDIKKKPTNVDMPLNKGTWYISQNLKDFPVFIFESDTNRNFITKT